jgi:TRAP transporter TAXI family solute receptor
MSMDLLLYYYDNLCRPAWRNWKWGSAMRWLALVLAAVAIAMVSPAAANDEAQATARAPDGPFGIAARRPIMQAACPTCVWGPFALITKQIMADYGYDIQICWNCNRHESPRFVADARIPHDLTPDEIRLNDPPPPKGPVDFGVTNERLALWAYHGINDYAGEPPRRNLRLLAHFEDPAYLIVAVREESGIADLADIAARKLPVRIHATADDIMLAPLLEYYAIKPGQLESWGGKYIGRREAPEGVDVLISRSGSNANNEESAIWNWAAATGKWRFLAMPKPLLDRMVAELGYRHVTLPVGYLPGVTEAIPTIERSGQAVIGRADMPDDFAYTLTKAMDERRLDYLWTIRPFASDPRQVWKLEDLPLHPGAERYYREAGYIR